MVSTSNNKNALDVFALESTRVGLAVFEVRARRTAVDLHRNFN